MKCSLGISNFLEEIFSLSHLIVFLYLFALFTKKPFLSLLAILWNSAFHEHMFPFLLCLLLLFFSQLMPLRQPLCLLAFLFLEDGFGHYLLYNVTNLRPLFFRSSCGARVAHLTP